MSNIWSSWTDHDQHMQQTSLAAYQEVKKSLNKSQQRVFAVFELKKTATNKEVAQHLKLPINKITPRTLELRKLNKLIQKGEVTREGTKQILWGPIK